jgi:AcrR family transcriptional regulator
MTRERGERRAEAEPEGAGERSPTLRERQAEQIRRELRSQFIRLVAERGVDGFTFQDLASAAGVSTRTLYRYFPSREAIIESLMESEARELDRELLREAGSLATFDTNPDLVASTFEVFDKHAQLVHAARLLGVTGFDGRKREERTRLVRQVIAETDGIDAATVDQLAALVRLLLGSETWSRLREADIDLDPREAGYAVHWAVQVLINAAAGEAGPLRPRVVAEPSSMAEGEMSTPAQEAEVSREG